ncbi:MAG: type II secretion system protein [Phycisphaerales bacterium]|nr:MAG: type II secretion system protein [Phycisphaerales bacterium]
MCKERGFALVELLIVIAIIALLLSVLMPALQRVKKQAGTAACLSPPKQWSLWFSMCMEEYGGCFMEGFSDTSKGAGSNRWRNNPELGLKGEHSFEQNHWRTPSVKGAGYVPLFLGAQRYNLWPQPTDTPPTFDGEQWQGDSMGRICLNRHDGFVNTLFLDFSAGKVGLKELWTLRWNCPYNMAGSWTMAGAVQPSDRPAWMRPLKDY